MTDKKSLLTRFEQRKRAIQIEKSTEESQAAADQDLAHKKSINELEDADMPDIDTLNADSDYSVFMSKKVSETLRRQALRKLFRLPGFNVLDGLNEYDEDYTKFEAMGEIIPYHMKEELKRKAQESAEQAAKTPSDEPEAEQVSHDTKPTALIKSSVDKHISQDIKPTALSESSTDKQISQDTDAIDANKSSADKPTSQHAVTTDPNQPSTN